MRTIVSTDLNANPRGFKTGTREVHQVVRSFFFSSISKNNGLCRFTFAAEMRLTVLRSPASPILFLDVTLSSVLASLLFPFFYLPPRVATFENQGSAIIILIPRKTRFCLSDRNVNDSDCLYTPGACGAPCRNPASKG